MIDDFFDLDLGQVERTLLHLELLLELMEGTAVGVGLQDSGDSILDLVNCLLFLGEGVVEGGIFTLLVPDVVEPAVIDSTELSVIVAIEGLGSEVDCFNLDLTPH